MSWRQKLRALFRAPNTHAEADAAIEAATRSHARAVEDRCRATATRAEADAWASQVRAHNVANHFDTWLQEVIRGGMR